MKLFMFYVGGDCGNANVELHDVRFSVGETAEDCFDDLRRQLVFRYHLVVAHVDPIIVFRDLLCQQPKLLVALGNFGLLQRFVGFLARFFGLVRGVLQRRHN